MKRHHPRRFPAVAWLALLPLAAGAAACAPSAEDCHDLMPVDIGPAIPAPTPASTRGCKATNEGVTIQVEAVRRNLRWERGRIWIDGLEAPETDLPSALAAARARHAATNLGAKAGQALRDLKDAAKSFRDGLRGQPQPQNPPPPPPQP
ncbi:MAG TPA: hypothetical protein VJA16_07600 [Thermoanaerobaculia bacterium]